MELDKLLRKITKQLLEEAVKREQVDAGKAIEKYKEIDDKEITTERRKEIYDNLNNVERLVYEACEVAKAKEGSSFEYKPDQVASAGILEKAMIRMAKGEITSRDVVLLSAAMGKTTLFTPLIAPPKRKSMMVLSLVDIPPLILLTKAICQSCNCML